MKINEHYVVAAAIILLMLLLSYDLLTSGKDEKLVIEQTQEKIEPPSEVKENLTDSGNDDEKEPENNEPEEIERFPEPNETIEEMIELEESVPGPEMKEPVNAEVTYFFFHADYCTTCQTMLPWIKELDIEHPNLDVELVDLHSGSSYVSKFAVTMTTVSVILRKENGVEVSGTKISGFMDKAAIERFICTELDDEICDNI